MRRIKLMIVAVLSTFCAASPVYPESPYIYPETEIIGSMAYTVLLRHTAWSVEHIYDYETGEQSCDADTSTDEGFDTSGGLVGFSMFSVSVQGNGGVNLLISGPRSLWSGEFQDDLFLAIDGEKWTLENANFNSHDGPHSSSRVSFGFPAGPASQRFMNQLFDGQSVTLLNSKDNGDHITWPLAGSAAVLEVLMECSEKIGARSVSSLPAAEPISFKGVDWSMSTTEQIAALEGDGLTCLRRPNWDTTSPLSAEAGEPFKYFCIETPTPTETTNGLDQTFNVWREECRVNPRTCFGRGGSSDAFRDQLQRFLRVTINADDRIIFHCSYTNSCNFSPNDILSELQKRVHQGPWEKPTEDSFIVCAEGPIGEDLCLHWNAKAILLFRPTSRMDF